MVPFVTEASAALSVGDELSDFSPLSVAHKNQSLLLLPPTELPWFRPSPPLRHMRPPVTVLSSQSL